MSTVVNGQDRLLTDQSGQYASPMQELIAPPRQHRQLGLSDERAVDLLRLMLLTRAVDERIWALNRQGRVGITAPARGQEAAQVGMASALERGRDIVLAYYRDVGVPIALGVSADQMLLDALGKQSGPFTQGRQMPFHWTSRELRLLSPSSSVATQIPHAVGAALASKLRGERAVTVVSFGDGATSKGDFHESLNMAGLWRLPVIFFCENNQYAISVPSSKQMATKTVAERAAAYNMPGYRIDGNDVLAVYGQVRQAVEQALDGGGPVLIEALTYRTMPHTSNDDDSKYRSREEVELWRGRDPILRYRAYLAEAHLLDPEAADALAEQVSREVAAATERALQAEDPPAREALDNLYAPGTRNAPRLDPRHTGVEEVAEKLKSEIGA